MNAVNTKELAVHKIMRHYTTRVSGKKALNYARINFLWEEANTMLYAYKIPKGFLFTKSRTESDNFVKETKVVSYGLGNYISLQKMFSEKVEYVSISKSEEGYCLLPAKKKDIPKVRVRTQRDAGYITGINSICITKYLRYFKGYDYVTVTCDMKNGAYLIVKPAKTQEYPRLKELQRRDELKGNSFYQNRVVTFSTTLTNGRVLSLPMPFLRLTDSKGGDTLPMWYNEEDGVLVIEAKAGICCVCGKPVNRYKTAITKYPTCTKCISVMPTLAKTLSESSAASFIDKTVEIIKNANVRTEKLNELSEIVDGMLNALK